MTPTSELKTTQPLVKEKLESDLKQQLEAVKRQFTDKGEAVPGIANITGGAKASLS